MIQEDIHSFNGLSMDKHPVAQDKDKLTDALNVRFISNETGSSFVLSNEVGTSDPGINFLGDYIGHCIVGDYLVIFSKEDNVSRIYIYDSKLQGNKIDLIWEDSDEKGYLNLTNESFESFGYVESDLVQKVYWVDADNSPRFINIMQYKLHGVDEDKKIDAYKNVDDFNFINTLNFNEDISILQNNSGGTFNQGVIQYAFTYYNKYGSESKVFYVSPLYYLGTENRGLAPDKTASASFNISISGLDNYEYLRIYALQRTAIDEEPSVRIVDEVKLDGNNTVSVLDNGTKGYASDYNTFAYIGGTDFKAKTMIVKDNTMFFGNIEYKVDESFLTIKEAVQNAYKNGDIRLEDSSNETNYYSYNATNIHQHCDATSFYNYETDLHHGGFKYNEYYKIAVQFQDSKGDWTEPIYLGNVILNTVYPYVDEKTYIQHTKFLHIPKGDLYDLISSKYSKMRLLYAYKPYSQRSILAQGIVSPTVFNLNMRSTNAPYAMSSWYFRPAEGALNMKDDNITTGHCLPLKTVGRGMEVQNMVVADELTQMEKIDKLSELDADTNTYNRFKHFFFVDENIVTFHSPDIENLRDLNFNNVNARVIGFVELNGYSQTSMLTTSETFGAEEGGFKKMPYTIGYNNNNVDTIYGSDYVYQDSVVRNDYKQSSIKTKAVNYKVCTFNKSGSVNNDVNRDEGTRSAELKKNIHSSIQFYNKLYKVTDENNNTSIKKPVFFDSETVDLKQVEVSYLDQKINYYGNVDEVIISQKKYPVSYMVTTASNLDDSDVKVGDEVWLNTASSKDNSLLRTTNDPVSMRYKSGKHLVFSFDCQEYNKIKLLPTINSASIVTDDYYSSQIMTSDKYKYSRIYSNRIKLIVRSRCALYKNGDYDKSGNGKTEYERSKQVVALDENSYPGFHTAIKSCLEDGDLVLWQSTTTEYDYNGEKRCAYFLLKWSKRHKNYLFFADQGRACNTAEYLQVQAHENGTIILSQAYKGGPIYTDSGYKSDTLFKMHLDKVDGNLFINYYSLAETSSVNDETNTLPTFDRDKFHVDQTYSGGRILPLLELYRTDYNPDDYDYEDKTDIWIPASDACTFDFTDYSDPEIDKVSECLDVPFKYGDTWFGRYDELKTYPFTADDENQVIEIGSFMCETVNNIDGRYDSRRGVIENFSATPDTYNVLNTVYNQQNNLDTYSILDEDSYRVNQNNTAILYSLSKNNNSIIDDWTNITALNSLYLDGTKGKLLNLKFFNNTIIAFQEEAVSIVNFNPRVQMPANDGTPVQLANTGKVDGYIILNHNVGLKHKDALCVSEAGIYFVDKNNNVYVTNGQSFINLSATNYMTTWCKNNFDDTLKLYYDNKNKDVYFVMEGVQTLCYNEYLQAFQSFYSYEDTQTMFNFNNTLYSVYMNKLYTMHTGAYNSIYGSIKPYYIEFVSNDNPTYTKTFDNIELYCDTPNSEDSNVVSPFNWVQVTNDYQDTSERKVDMKKRFNLWRLQLPRCYKFSNKGVDSVRSTAMTRIRNTWCKIKLGLYNTRFAFNQNYKVNVNYIKVKYNLGK
jgi:hypothetical protein